MGFRIAYIEQLHEGVTLAGGKARKRRASKAERCMLHADSLKLYPRIITAIKICVKLSPS